MSDWFRIATRRCTSTQGIQKVIDFDDRTAGSKVMAKKQKKRCNSLRCRRIGSEWLPEGVFRPKESKKCLLSTTGPQDQKLWPKNRKNAVTPYAAVGLVPNSYLKVYFDPRNPKSACFRLRARRIKSYGQKTEKTL